MKYTATRLTIAASLALVAATTAFAVTPPDAGTLLQQLHPILEAPKPSPEFQIESQPLHAVTHGGQVVAVSDISIKGNSVYTEAQLIGVLGNVIGKQYDLGGMRGLANTISQFYRNNGYPFARAFIPAQQMEGGKLIIEVLEGKYGRVYAAGAESFIAPTEKYLRPLASGSVIESSSIERTTLLIDDLPGIKALPVVRPGSEMGTGDLQIRVAEEPRVNGNVEFDNHGSRYSGAYRAKAGVNISRLLAFGDQLSLGVMYTDQSMWFGHFNYSLPLGISGLRGNIGYSQTAYDLGKEFADLNATGTATVSSTGMTYPIVRSQPLNITATATYQHKQLRDKMAGSETNKSTSQSVPLGFNFDVRDSFGGGAITYGTVLYTQGNLDIRNDLQKSLDDTTAQTDGSFRKANLELARIQNLPARFSGFVRFSGQRALGMNLSSAENISLGGANGVRAYPQGEASGNHGYLMQTEVRYQVDNHIQPYLFYDFGRVTVNAKPWQNVQNSRSLEGAGLGLRYQRSNWNMDIASAWRIAGGEPTSATNDPKPRLWVSLGHRF